MASRINIIGSSHIAKESVESVKREVEEFSPEIIALELDKKRAYAMLHKLKRPNFLGMIRSVGIKGFLFSLIGSYAQKKLGRIVGVDPGAEMITALKLAKKNNLRLMLIDQDIEVTLRKFSKAITWREKGRFVADILKAVFGVRPKILFDIKKVPDDKLIRKLILEIKKRYPNVHDVLIDQRNKIMAKRLFIISKNYPNDKILCIVGAGHKEEIISLLKKYEKEN